jgi:type IV pilus assembly protein PilV
MRANPDGNYVHSAAPTSDTDCVIAACSVEDLADYDMETWWAQVTAVLPSGSGQVALLAGSANIFVLTVRWDEDRSGSAGTNCPALTAADLECYRLNVTI